MLLQFVCARTTANTVKNVLSKKKAIIIFSIKKTNRIILIEKAMLFPKNN